MKNYLTTLDSIFICLGSGDSSLILRSISEVAQIVDDIDSEDQFDSEAIQRRINRIRSMLITLYEENMNTDVRTSIVWLLGKFHDDGLKPFFIKVLF